jgi:hypothetical protein
MTCHTLWLRKRNRNVIRLSTRGATRNRSPVVATFRASFTALEASPRASRLRWPWRKHSASEINQPWNQSSPKRAGKANRTPPKAGPRLDGILIHCPLSVSKPLRSAQFSPSFRFRCPKTAQPGLLRRLGDNRPCRIAVHRNRMMRRKTRPTEQTTARSARQRLRRASTRQPGTEVHRGLGKRARPFANTITRMMMPNDFVDAANGGPDRWHSIRISCFYGFVERPQAATVQFCDVFRHRDCGPLGLDLLRNSDLLGSVGRVRVDGLWCSHPNRSW